MRVARLTVVLQHDVACLSVVLQFLMGVSGVWVPWPGNFVIVVFCLLVSMMLYANAAKKHHPLINPDTGVNINPKKEASVAAPDNTEKTKEDFGRMEIMIECNSPRLKPTKSMAGSITHSQGKITQCMTPRSYLSRESNRSETELACFPSLELQFGENSLQSNNSSVCESVHTGKAVEFQQQPETEQLTQNISKASLRMKRIRSNTSMRSSHSHSHSYSLMCNSVSPWQVQKDVVFVSAYITYNMDCILELDSCGVEAIKEILTAVGGYRSEVGQIWGRHTKGHSGSVYSETPATLVSYWNGQKAAVKACEFSQSFCDEINEVTTEWVKKVRKDHGFSTLTEGDTKRQVYTDILNDRSKTKRASIISSLLDTDEFIASEAISLGITMGDVVLCNNCESNSRIGMVSPALMRVHALARLGHVICAQTVCEQLIIERNKSCIARPLVELRFTPEMVEPQVRGNDVNNVRYLYEILSTQTQIDQSKVMLSTDIFEMATQCIRDGFYTDACDLIEQHIAQVPKDAVACSLRNLTEDAIRKGCLFGLAAHAETIEIVRVDENQSGHLRRRSTVFTSTSKGLVDMIMEASIQEELSEQCDSVVSESTRPGNPTAVISEVLAELGRTTEVVYLTDEQKEECHRAKLWGRIKAIYEACLSLLLLFYFFRIPFLMTFHTSSDESFAIADTVLLTFCYGHIAMTFVTPIEINGKLLYNRKKITRIYLRSGFTFDLICCFPLELVGFLAGYHWSDPRFRINRVLYILRVPRMAKNVIDFMWPSINPISLKMARFMLILCCSAHLMACGWWSFLEQSSTDDLYKYLKTRVSLVEGSPISSGHKYSLAFEWVIKTLFGYGSPWPVTDLMTSLSLTSSLIGVAVFAHFLAATAAVLAAYNSNKNDHQETVDNMIEWLSLKRAPSSFKKDVISYYRYLWKVTRCISTTQFDFLLEEVPGGLPALPLKLAERLRFHLNSRIVTQVPMLAKHIGNHGFTTEIIQALRLEAAVPGAVIIAQGDEPDTMFFVVGGRVSVYFNNTFKVADITQGDFFGEMSLIFKTSRSCTVVCDEYTQLFSLPKCAFFTIARAFPSCFYDILSVAESRRKSLNDCKLKFSHEMISAFLPQITIDDDDDDDDCDKFQKSESSEDEDDPFETLPATMPSINNPLTRTVRMSRRRLTRFH